MRPACAICAMNWIRKRCRPVGLNVHTPLWRRDRDTLLQQMLERGFKVRFSCVDTCWIDQSWVGRELDATAIDALRIINEQTGLDLCGEDGEYHTMAVDGPGFTRGIDIRNNSIRVTRSLAYMDRPRIGLKESLNITAATLSTDSAPQ